MKADNSPAILIIEDEAGLAQALRAACEQMGHRSRAAANARAGLEQARHLAGSLRLIVLDIGLPDRSGLDLLPQLRELLPAVPVLIITAHGSLQNAVAARQQGAADYLVKPLDLAVFDQAVTTLLKQTPAMPRAACGDDAGEDIPVLTGASPAMQPVFKAVASACTSNAPVLLRGPSGSGKTLAARVIHNNSSRASGPFITLPCGGMSGALLESELFGHEQGAFPGATAAVIGLLEKADGGTLLLDEIGDLPAETQARLLRFVEEKKFSRPGDSVEHSVDVRLIAATQRDLAGEVTAGRFRKDLYFRLNVIEIALPALRQRMDDIPALARDLLKAIAPERHLELAPETLTRLRGYDWPGHVRELRNALEHAAAQSTGAVLQPSHLPPALRGAPDTVTIDRRLDNAIAAWAAVRLKQAGIHYDALHDELESRLLTALLPHFDNRPTRLATALNMNRNTLRKRLERDHPAESPPD